MKSDEFTIDCQDILLEGSPEICSLRDLGNTSKPASLRSPRLLSPRWILQALLPWLLTYATFAFEEERTMNFTARNVVFGKHSKELESTGYCFNKRLWVPIVEELGSVHQWRLHLQGNRLLWLKCSAECVCQRSICHMH